MKRPVELGRGAWMDSRAEKKMKVRFNTNTIYRTRIVIRQVFMSPWVEQRDALAKPWNVEHRWQPTIGFKLLAVARGEPITTFTDEHPWTRCRCMLGAAGRKKCTEC